jgi:translocation and assembly module TamB
LQLALMLGQASVELQAGAADPGAGGGAWSVSGRVRNLDPQRLLASAPAARLNLDFEGRALPGARLQARLALPASRFGAHPLAGKAEFELEERAQGWRLSALQLALDVAGNRLQASGNWGSADDRLVFNADLPALAALGYGLGGRAGVEGHLGGGLDTPRGTVRFFAEALCLPGALTLRGVNGEAGLDGGSDGAFRLSVGLSGLLRQGEALVDSARIAAAGTRAQHRLNFEIEGGGHDRLGGQLEGGLPAAAGLQWKGLLTVLESTGRLATRLSAPVALELAPDRISLGEALILAGEHGRIHLQQTAWTPAESVARGSLSGLALDLRAPRSEGARPRSSTLVLGAEWDLRAGSTLAGEAKVFREAGDLVVEGELRTRLGLEALQLQLQASGTQLRLNALLQGRELGRIDASAVLPLARSAGGSWWPASQAPVQGRARFEMPSIAWLGRLLEENIELGGRLDGEVELAGTLAEPRFVGQIAGRTLQFALLDQGLQLRDGELELRFDRDRLRLERLVFAAPNRVRPRDRRIPFQRLTATPGALTASGELALDSGTGTFEFSAERVPLLQHPERWLMLSGGGRLRSSWSRLDVEADLRVDAAALEFADTPAPGLSEDVVVLQREGRAAGEGFALGVAVRIDLGEALYLSAMGVDTRLAGKLLLRQHAGGPLQAVGTVATVGGTYHGYGQQLTVERGLINFNGALDNPGLNVVALRKGLAVEAGVEILGSARRPLVRLASEPVVPDPEKLSWMVLGRAPDAASGADLGLLLPAAQALLGGPGGGMTEQLARSLGFDSISIGQGELNRTTQRSTSRVAGGGTTVASGPTVSGQVLSVGKRLGSGLMLSFEKGLGEAETLVRLTYQLSRRLSLVLRGGADNAIDLEYGFSFR